MIVPSIIPFALLGLGSIVSATPVEKRQASSNVAANASLLNNAVAYQICLLSRGAFAAVIALGVNVSYPACSAYDILHPAVASVTATTTASSTLSSTSSSSAAFVTPTNAVGSLAFPYCPSTAPTSCSAFALSHNTTIDTCCTNSPGGYFLLTQFWDYSPAAGPNNSWTIHGLWPDNCDGTYFAFCDPSRTYTNITAIMQNAGTLGNDTLSYMNSFWKDQNGNDESFWEHEFNKHGQCIASLVPSCYGSSYIPQQEVVQYFARTVAMFKNLPSYDWLAAAGIVPSITANYTLAQLQAVAVANTGFNAFYGCSRGVLGEIWYGYTLQGNIANGNFINAQILPNSSCPATGIKYYPKGYTPPSTVIITTNSTSSISSPSSSSSSSFSSSSSSTITSTSSSSSASSSSSSSTSTATTTR